jgi:hypothetical protein
MAGDTPVILEHLDSPISEPHVHPTADQPVRHRVKSLVDIDVVVGIHLGGLPLGAFEWLARHRRQGLRARSPQTAGGSDRGAQRAAAMGTLIKTAKLNDIDRQAWLADVLARINESTIHRLDELLPENWRKPLPNRAEAA